MWGVIMVIQNLDINKEKLRDLHLRKLALGQLYGPLTNVPNIDKEWLKYYTEEQILESNMPIETMYDYMFKKNLDHLDDVAIVYFSKKITYREFKNKIEECAKSLEQKGIKADDIVTICMPNTPEALVMFYAINKIGAIANMVHPLSSENEIKNFVNEVDSKMIVTIDSTYSKVSRILNETKLENVIVVKPSDSMPFFLKLFYNLKNNCDLRYDSKTIAWEDFIKCGKQLNISKSYPYKEGKISVIMHSGGTTGTPKGIKLTNDNFNCMVEQFIINAENFERGDKMLTVMPVFHGFGLCSSVHLPLSQGVSTILIPKIDIKNIDKTLNKYKPNHILGVPTLFKGIKSNIEAKISSGKLKSFDLSYLKYAVCGGDASEESFEDETNRFFSECGSRAKLAKGYGLSEAVAGVTFAYNGYNETGSVGIPMIRTNIKIVQPGTNTLLHNNEVGEICVQSPDVMEGYIKHETETREALRDGWLHTGDMGYFDKGILYFSQRKSNMIISSGVNVYPSVIEKVVEKHPAVQQCVVIGIYHPYKQEVPKAYIVLKEGYELTEEIKSEIESLCHCNLNKYSIPYSYEYRDSFPKTLYGKVSRQTLKQENVDEIPKQKKKTK